MPAWPSAAACPDRAPRHGPLGPAAGARYRGAPVAAATNGGGSISGDGAGKAVRRAASGERRSPLRRAAWWSACAAVAYALTLTLASDTVYFLAIPGLIGLAVVVVVAVQSVLHGPFAGAGVPFPTDGSDRRSAVRYHYAVLVRRYAVVAGASAVCMVLPLVVSVFFLYPLIGVGVMALVTGTPFWLEQMGRVRRCSRDRVR